MYPLVFKHLTCHDLPKEWAKQLPAEQVFSVMIVTEKPVPQQSIEELAEIKTPLFGIWRDYEPCQNVEEYVRHLRRNRFEMS